MKYELSNKGRERILTECRALISEVEPPQNWRTRIYRILDTVNATKPVRKKDGVK